MDQFVSSVPWKEKTKHRLLIFMRMIDVLQFACFLHLMHVSLIVGNVRKVPIYGVP